jgi:hypothetical protein
LGGGEFLERKPAKFLSALLTWSLFVFVQVGFGLWLTKDFSGAFQHFMYFSGTLLSLQFVVMFNPRSLNDRTGNSTPRYSLTLEHIGYLNCERVPVGKPITSHDPGALDRFVNWLRRRKN